MPGVVACPLAENIQSFFFELLLCGCPVIRFCFAFHEPAGRKYVRNDGYIFFALTSYAYD